MNNKSINPLNFILEIFTIKFLLKKIKYNYL